MNTHAKVQQVAMLSLLQELILASFDASYEAEHTVPAQQQSSTLQVSK